MTPSKLVKPSQADVAWMRLRERSRAAASATRGEAFVTPALLPYVVIVGVTLVSRQPSRPPKCTSKMRHSHTPRRQVRVRYTKHVISQRDSIRV